MRAVSAAAAIVLGVNACVGTPAPAPGKPWHHLANGTFRNPPGSPEQTAGIGDMLSFFARRMRDRPPAVPPGHVVDPAAARAAFEAAADENTVTWLGHAAFLLRIDGRTILTDPYLTETAGPTGLGPKRFVAPGLPLASLPPIDVVVVSHNHYDHLDAPTVEALPGKDRVTVVVPLGLGEFFRDRGYARVEERDWFESWSDGDIEVEVLPAIHFSRRGPFDRNRSLWSGFAIRTGGYRIYHSGDTGYGPVFREIGERSGPFDLALVAIGAYDPPVIMQPVHLTPEEAIRVVGDVRAERAIGMHWGTVQLTDEPPFEPPQRFADAARAAGRDAAHAGVMRIGETRVLPPVD